MTVSSIQIYLNVLQPDGSRFPSSVCPKTPFDRKIPHTPDAFVHARSGLPLTPFPFRRIISSRASFCGDPTGTQRLHPGQQPENGECPTCSRSFSGPYRSRLKESRLSVIGTALPEAPAGRHRKPSFGAPKAREPGKNRATSNRPLALSCTAPKERLFPSWRRPDSVLRQARLQATLPFFCPEKDTRSEAGIPPPGYPDHSMMRGQVFRKTRKTWTSSNAPVSSGSTISL